MATPEDIARRESDRFRVLEAIYDGTGGNHLRFARFFNVATGLGIPQSEQRDALSYLTRSGLLDFHGSGGGVTITLAGVNEVEAKRRKPAEPTEHFPAPVTITINGNVGAIQHGSGNVANVAQQIGMKVDEVSALVGELRAAAPEVEPAKRKRFEAAVNTVEKLAKSGEPDGDALELAAGFLEDSLSPFIKYAGTLATLQAIVTAVTGT